MINHDKAYILGLLVGNGTISNGTFAIKLPLKKWGMQPEKMHKIATDILHPTQLIKVGKKDLKFVFL